jgi:hypothetical protein
MDFPFLYFNLAQPAANRYCLCAASGFSQVLVIPACADATGQANSAAGNTANDA